MADEHTELLRNPRNARLKHVRADALGHRPSIERMSNDVFLVAQGSLYPALVRMKRRGWVKTEWRITENSRRARYYELTAAGRRQLDSHYTAWQRASAAIDGIMTATLAMAGAEP